ncbi:MAG: hypothetical protein J6R35_05275 [Clostridia bacterium]|nr:hypothetical protein [Clostridia bacterium]
MIYTHEEIKSFIANCLSVPQEDIVFKSAQATCSMTARLEDGGSDTLLGIECGGKEYIVKIKSTAFDDNVCDAMNYLDLKEFNEYFSRGKNLFYIRDSYNREAKMYRAFGSIKDYFPKIYGSASDASRSILLMEKLKIERTPNDKEAAAFLIKLHSLYNRIEDAQALGANVHTAEDYVAATDISLKLIDYIELAYPDFPKAIIKAAQEFVYNYQSNFNKMTTYPRTLCHVDFTINNTTTAEGFKAYDLELATYNNGEFDLISYLYHYPIVLNDSCTNELLNAYYLGKNSTLSDNLEVVKLNVVLYFCTRFHAMMLIAKKLPMPYMGVSIENAKYLFNRFVF